MRKKYLLILLCNLIFAQVARAQTWDGSAGTDWNTPANWSTNAVPTSASSVTISNTPNKPVLNSNVTIASLDMNTGSALNFNGRTLAVNGSFSIAGATLNNTNPATDIVIAISGASSKYFGASVINDNITINYNATTPMYEGYLQGNTYNGNTIINITGMGTLYTCYNQKSSFNGNFTINRTVAGITYIFNAGFNSLTGNFNYVNTVGGDSYINPNSVASGAIGGMVNITANGLGNPDFTMNKIRNLTNGGSISAQNSGGVTIQDDTVRLTALNVNGFTGSSADYFRSNLITANVSFSDAAANTGSVYIGANTIGGNTTYSANAAIPWYEGYLQGDQYNGNTIFNITGTGTLYTCYNQKSSFNGNLTINRTGAGVTYIFNNGFNSLTGNFSYVNSAGGNSYINPGSVASGDIGGTINITANGLGNPDFTMNKISNLTNSGSISVQNSGGLTIQDDTLKLAALNLNGFTGSSADYFRSNSVTGNVSFSDAAANTGSVYIGENTIAGNTTYASNAAIPWYEGYLQGDTYNGNTIINITGTGTLYACYNQKSSFNGNLTINRTGVGATYLFNTGFSALTGNFSYTNNAGGDNYINPGSVASATIGGTVNISAAGTGNPPFTMNRISNVTNGGSISVQNSGGLTIENDTLRIATLNVNGFSGSSADNFRRNSITGNVTFSDVAANSGSVYIGGNIIRGNTTFTSSASIPWYGSYLTSDTYDGNITFNRNSGTINLAYNDAMYVNQNLVFNSTAGLVINTVIEFGGSTIGSLEQLGSQPISIPTLIMKKTGGAGLTLNDSVTVTSGAIFTSGNIYTSTGNNLIFPNNIGYTGSSATSHVVGPVTKIGDDAFTFPTGGPTSLNEVRISAPVGATSRFRAEYKNQNPTIDGYNTNIKAASFGAAIISNAGYWDVQRLSGTTNVTLTLGFNTNPYEQYPVLANLKVAHWNGAQWADHGNAGTTGTAASGTVVNIVPITTFSPFAIAAARPTYFFSSGQPGPGPDGSPIKLGGIGGWPGYTVKQLPVGAYTGDSIFLEANGSTTSFRVRDVYGVEKDTTITAPASPVNYISANGNGTVNFTGWRHFVYLRNAGNQIIGAIRDNNLTLGNTTMTAYFSTQSTATAPNGNIFAKRSFKITSQFAPVGTRRARFYISKTEFNDLQAADPASFPNGINSLTITRYTGPQEDSLFNPVPGGNSIIIPNSDITISDLGSMYSLDIDVPGFSGFYIGGNQSNVNICAGSTISLPSNVSGAAYQWQVDNGSGYVNIGNTTVYGGVTTKTLTLTNAPGTLYGYKLRCVVNGVTFSQVYTIRFTALWQGSISNVWENAANWGCGVVPDANTDVIINAGKPNFPQLGSNASIRSLRVAAGAAITVKTGFNLTITK
ncbi:MAG: hypothetical protein ABI707_05065 [Ferruginibacter sp.]